MRKSASGDENSPYFRYNGKLSADLRRKAYLYRRRYPRRPKDVEQARASRATMPSANWRNTGSRNAGGKEEAIS